MKTSNAIEEEVDLDYSWSDVRDGVQGRIASFCEEDGHFEGLGKVPRGPRNTGVKIPYKELKETCAKVNRILGRSDPENGPPTIQVTQNSVMLFAKMIRAGQAGEILRAADQIIAERRSQGKENEILA